MDGIGVKIGADERLDEVNEHITLIQKKEGLTFGTDAYLLASFVRPLPRGRAVELGAGSGIVSLLCAAKGRFSHIFSVEIQEDFASLISRNVSLNGMEDRISVRHADARDLRPVDFGGEVDAVFANPPYMRTDSGARNESDYKYIARHEVFGGIGDFCLSASRLLKTGGKFYCVWRPDRLGELMEGLTQSHLAPKRMTFVHADVMSEPSMVLVEASKEGGKGMRVTRPLFLYEKEADGKTRIESADARQIYETMSFQL